MKILFHNFHTRLNRDNLLFTSDNTDIGDNLLTPFKVMKDEAKKRGINIGTSHVINKEEADAMVFLDHPGINNEMFQYGIKNDIPLFLITLESPIIKSEIFSTELHNAFKKILTWSDCLIANDSGKYTKINYSYNIKANFELGKRNRDLIVISGNKVSKHPQELYSERLRVIKWYENHNRGYLDLYGTDWDIKIFHSNILGLIVNKINRKYKLIKNNYSSYKGKIKRKAEILAQYNFCLCFENAYGFSGYITEKIFDSLMAGAIPIYKGADNIAEYIPKNCYINYDDFSTIGEMHKFLTNLTDNEIVEYQLAIRKFLSSSAVDVFSIETFVKTSIETIIDQTKCF
ncbi:glycosyltransferase family 10 domain-containing protein [Pedobacter paludis]|nr:glycosyltransferase family 10 [Pedobacter paludis]